MNFMTSGDFLPLPKAAKGNARKAIVTTPAVNVIHRKYHSRSISLTLFFCCRFVKIFAENHKCHRHQHHCHDQHIGFADGQKTD